MANPKPYVHQKNFIQFTSRHNGIAFFLGRAAPAPPRRFPPQEADPVLDSRDRLGKPDRTCALSLPLPVGEILQGVHRPTLTAQLEVQLIAVRIRVAQDRKSTRL